MCVCVDWLWNCPYVLWSWSVIDTEPHGPRTSWNESEVQSPPQRQFSILRIASWFAQWLAEISLIPLLASDCQILNFTSSASCTRVTQIRRRCPTETRSSPYQVRECSDITRRFTNEDSNPEDICTVSQTSLKYLGNVLVTSRPYLSITIVWRPTAAIPIQGISTTWLLLPHELIIISSPCYPL